MVTSFTSPSCTLLTKSVSEIVLSFLPGPALTNTNSIAANRSRTTQKSNVFRFELTKPPQPAFTYLYRRHPACFRFSYSQHCNASGTRRAIRGRTEQSRPDDGFPIRKDRPMPPLPYRNTEFLKKSFDLFLARAAYGLILVPRPPISQHHAARQSTPVKITYPIIIYVMGRIGSFRFFNQFQGDFDPRRFCADNPRYRGLNRIGTIHPT